MSKVVRLKKKCRWFAGKTSDGGEAKCLRYTPTQRQRPSGWKYAIGPFKTKREALRTINYQGWNAR